MFWDNFYALCLAHETKPNPVAKKLGFSSATVTKWKSGTSPNLNAAANIAEYFHVTIDELLYGLSSKCYRCGYDLNPSYAKKNKKCGEYNEIRRKYTFGISAVLPSCAGCEILQKGI